jgi:hypothetical protein
VHSAKPHLHFTGDLCPLCEQPIPHEELDRIIAKARKRDAEITAPLQEQFARQKAQDEAKAEADLERVKQEAETARGKLMQESLARESAAREEGKASAEAAAAAKLTNAETARAAAAEESASLKAALEKAQKDGAAAIEHERQQATANEQAARAEGRLAAEAASQEKLAQAEAATAAAVNEQANLKAELHKVREDGAAAAEKNRAEAAANEAVIRAEAVTAAESAAQVKINAAEAARIAAEEQAQALKAAHATELGQQRESLEKASLKTLQEERAGWFGEKQKLEEKLQDVTRQLQSKSPDELGDGAELDLFEVLKEAFPEDKITRYAKGEPGADTLHEVYHNGKLCGRIVYESKNASGWLYDWVAKLRRDQTAAKADHAILSTYKLPSNAKQVHVHDTVIVCQPARVLVLAQILRRHIVQVHSLRHSNEERANKTEALYNYITSARFGQFLEDIKTHTATLEEIDVNEVKAHKKTWEKRGEVHRKILRVHADLSFEIDGIIGTGADADGSADMDADAAQSS